MTWLQIGKDPWLYATIVLIIGVMITLVPLCRRFFKKVQLEDVRPWFEESDGLGNQRERVASHFERMRGTLVYWKNKAAAYRALENARIFWSILSSVTLPVLVQVYDSSAVFANVFFTGLTVWTGGLVTYAYTVKAEQKYQGFRSIESDYYDESRELLDFAQKEPAELEDRVEIYFRTVAKIREMARDVETGRPASARRLMT